MGRRNGLVAALCDALDDGRWHDPWELIAVLMAFYPPAHLCRLHARMAPNYAHRSIPHRVRCGAVLKLSERLNYMAQRGYVERDQVVSKFGQRRRVRLTKLGSTMQWRKQPLDAPAGER